jgi:hypothetical protein
MRKWSVSSTCDVLHLKRKVDLLVTVNELEVMLATKLLSRSIEAAWSEPAWTD